MKGHPFRTFVLPAVVISLALVRCSGHSEFHTVAWVYDGDTIRIDDGRKVRLIGVDAPEIDSPYAKGEPFGEESRRYLMGLLKGKAVSLKPGREPCDRYGRTLAYVYADNVLVNGRIIRDGWARAYEAFDYEYKDLFMAYEMEAQSKGIGIWHEGEGPGAHARHE